MLQLLYSLPMLTMIKVYYAGARIGYGNGRIEIRVRSPEANKTSVKLLMGGCNQGERLFPILYRLQEKNAVIYNEKDKTVNRHNVSEIPTGRIGLFHENTITQYDDFEAEGPKVKGLPVQPLGKLAVTWTGLKSTRD